MNYTSRMKYGTSLANNYYVDRLCNKLVSSPLIYSVFASIEKDRNEEHNHLHLLFSSKHKLNRYKLSKLSGFNSLGIGNVDNIKNKTGVSKYVAKHIGRDFSYHNLYI